jgi:hypothetical protein
LSWDYALKRDLHQSAEIHTIINEHLEGLVQTPKKTQGRQVKQIKKTPSESQVIERLPDSLFTDVDPSQILDKKMKETISPKR